MARGMMLRSREPQAHHGLPESAPFDLVALVGLRLSCASRGAHRRNALTSAWILGR